MPRSESWAFFYSSTTAARTEQRHDPNDARAARPANEPSSHDAGLTRVTQSEISTAPSDHIVLGEIQRLQEKLNQLKHAM